MVEDSNFFEEDFGETSRLLNGQFISVTQKRSDLSLVSEICCLIIGFISEIVYSHCEAFNPYILITRFIAGSGNATFSVELDSFA